MKEIKYVLDFGDDTCVYCGENKFDLKILNPNFPKLDDEPDEWKVCKCCSEVIKLQKKLSLAMVTEDDGLVEEINFKLRKLSEESGKPIFNVKIDKEGVTKDFFGDMSGR